MCSVERWQCAILFQALLLGGASCVAIDGGAVEASWVVRTPDGHGIEDCACADPAIARIRFRVVGPDGVDRCAGKASCGFSCARRSGATAFDIPPGSYAISLVPSDGAGVDLTRIAAGQRAVQVPVAALTRDVVHGQTTELEAFQVVAACADSCGGPNHVCRR